VSPAAPRRLWLFLPAYEEEANLPLLLADARDTFAAWAGGPDWAIVVVDDGSRDGTARAATSVEGARVTLLSHGVNRGLGAASPRPNTPSAVPSSNRRFFAMVCAPVAMPNGSFRGTSSRRQARCVMRGTEGRYNVWRAR